MTTVNSITAAMRAFADDGRTVVFAGELRDALGEPRDFGVVLRQAQRAGLIAHERIRWNGRRPTFLALPENGHHLAAAVTSIRTEIVSARR